MNTTTDIDFFVPEPQNAQELADLVQNTITHIQDQFGHMSDSILTRIDDMGRRIDELERNLSQVIPQTNTKLP